MRKYQPAWNAIKEQGHASLSAPKDKHRRIIQAIRKEKAKDYPWKLSCLERGKKYKLEHEIEGSVIHFRLTEVSTLSYANLSINDL